MGNESSSPDSEHQAAAAVSAVTAAAKMSESGRGRESLTTQKEVELESEIAAPSATELDEEVEAVLVEEPALVESDESESEDDEFEDESEDEYDEEDEELEEGLRERLRILEDARALKNLAAHFLRPEVPVSASPEVFGRNYFGRASAPDREDAEEAKEVARALADARELKETAAQYAHPEAGVVTEDAAAAARCFFDRPSAPARLSKEEADEIAQSLSDAAQLKKLAIDHAHPEQPVETSDPAALGRCCFSRPSAEAYEEEETDADRDDVFADMAELKKAAFQYLHPEAPVEVDPAAFGRCYFNRASAPDTEEEDIDAERDDVLQDAAELRKLASDFAHPEKPVQDSDPTTFGRNYFNRASAPETEEEDIEAERDEVLEDAAELKKLASDYAHPEKPVSVDPASFGRSYFGRASVPEQDGAEDAEERAAALEDALALKKLAADYAHPEKTVVTSDPAAFGRNYFDRPSAGEYEEEEVDADRDDILADMAFLKKLAIDYAHPEKPVQNSDPTTFGRNYFHRASAPETEEEDVDAERDEVLEDALALKKLAADFSHPEKPFNVDPAAFGRSYFGRASAPQEEKEVAEECAAALADALALKKLAADYAHPEVGVASSDPAAFGRSYFSRPSAEDYEEEEVDADRDDVLADMAALKKLAVDFSHPEKPVENSDPTTFGRNYFDRASAPQTEEEDIDAECDEVLEDMLALKELAADFSHPERPVVVDPAAFGRNYFGRASAPEQDESEDAEERAAALADAQALKKLATYYSHPEVGVVTSDPAAFGRNYFGRPSAIEYEEEEVDADRDDVLADVAALQKLAADYAHPEKPIETSDPTAFCRNYFNHASAPDTEEEEIDAERDEVLEDLLALKKLAADFAHPENPVDTDPAAFGRNYFGHVSAPDQEDQDEAEERAAALADAKALGKLATDYHHPEVGVATSDPAAFGRNYFGRPSASEYEEEEVDADRDDILADMVALKTLAVDYAHPERGVETSDPAAFGRNYFNRASAPDTEEEDIDAERDEILEDVLALKKLAVDFAHPERPVDPADPASFGRNYFGRPSAPDQEGESDAEENATIFVEVSQLRKLAKDYAHPEEPVQTTDPAVFGRNYFSRPSAPEQDGQDEAEERVRSLADASGLEKLAKDYAHPEAGVETTDPTAMARCYYSWYSSPTHQDNLITAKSTMKPPAQAAPLGGEFEHVPAASDEQSQQGDKKAPQEGDKKAPQDGDIPRTSSSHMLFGMAEAS